MTKIEKLKELEYVHCGDADSYVFEMVELMREIIIEQQEQIERFNQFHDSGTPIVVPNKRFLIPIDKEPK